MDAHAQSTLDFTKQCVNKRKNLWVRNLFSFYNVQCPSERINSELSIIILLGRNHLTKYVCCSTWHARGHMIRPELKHTGRKQHVQHPECR